MMNFIRWWINTAFVLWEKLKGPAPAFEVPVPFNLLAHLTAYAVSGYEIKLFCQKKHYCRNYRRWFDKHYVAYRVYSVVTNDAPLNLKEVCELDVCIPAAGFRMISEEVQREVAVQVYLDLLIERLKYQSSV